MPSSIPNDIYQYSLWPAFAAGLDRGGPRVADLINHGTYGVGVFEKSPSSSPPNDASDGSGALPFATPPKEMVQIEGKAYSIAYDGTVEAAEPRASLPYAMVTVFQPTQRVELHLSFTFADLRKVVWPNSPMPFRITGAFRSVHTKQGLYEDVEGTIFGFMIPKWQATVSGDEYSQMRFIDDDRRQGGGSVLGFEAGEGVLLESGGCGRFHLGFPQNEQFNQLKF
ncbi:hypothetical protein PG993_009706 [Apiospora rasikravindrae]|uniref:Alpha-acetolactate decarboxylase n=1 Tax=Apiospora rasikravindrae TaxID=990691 RepID=A0ABR1SK42_9PEZI